MIHPRIDQLLENVNERYALVIVAAKRARQINNYHHQLGEGTFDDDPPPLVESRSKNYLTMALEEISEGKIKFTYKELTPFACMREPLVPRRLLLAGGAVHQTFHGAGGGLVIPLSPLGSEPPAGQSPAPAAMGRGLRGSSIVSASRIRSSSSGA